MSTFEQRRIGTLLLVPAVSLLAACGGSQADEPEAAEETPVEEVAPVVPSGALITLSLDETLSTSSHDAGNRVTATVTEPVRGQGGEVLIPSGATMIGVVDQSERSTGPETPAVLSFHFETLRVGGASYPVSATVEEAEPRHTAGDSDTESVAKVVIGTAAGALVGQILGGDTESTLKGAAAGTLAGAAVAITSQHGDATLASGSLITVRTEEPIRLD